MSTDSLFDLQVGAPAAGALRVVSFAGRERLSRPFRFEVVAASRDVDEAKVLAEVIGRPACLTLHGPAGSRCVRGVVRRWASGGAHLHDRTAWRIRVVPRLATLDLRRRSRIFQEKTPQEIVSTVLDEGKIPHRWETVQAYPARAYCVQYEETDLDFVQRLLAEIGVFYRFEHAGEDVPALEPEVLVLGDRAHYLPIEGEPRLVYRYALPGSTLALEEHHVTRFHAARAAAPAAYLRRDYDFLRPLSPLEARATGEAAPGEGEVYEHHGEFGEAESEQALEAAALEQLRRKSQVATGESACLRLLPGRRFTLAEHELTGHDGEHLVTSIEHEGHSPETATPGTPTYQNRFRCVPAALVSRPPRRARQFRQNMETAIVTGPAGQEIYTDAHGRVKVQFHWDREGKRDERSSCWLRVAQAWSGTGWGFQFVPRIGMEVLVSFLGGDPDRPVVVGCVPNATHPPPYPLPENQTKSGIKTESTPGGGGFNEILFDDRKGGEVLSIRAERNLTESALHDHLQTVGHDQTVVVAGKRATEIQGEDTLRVDGGQTWIVQGASSLSVGGGASSMYAGARSTSVAGDDTTRIAGGHTVLASAYSHLLIGHGAPEGHGLVYVNGNYRIGAAAAVEVGAATRLLLSCGDSSIELLPGEIKLKSPKVTIVAADELYAKGKDHELAFTDHAEIRGEDVRLFGKEGQLLLDENARLNGKVVKLNCDRPKPEEKKLEDESATGTITFKIVPHFPMEEGEPLVAVIATPTGKTVEMPVDANLEVKLEGKPGERFMLVDLKKGTLPAGKRGA